MINQTKEQFVKIIDLHNIDMVSNGVIVATLRLKLNEQTTIGHIPTPSMFKNVVLYKASDFIFQEASSQPYKSISNGGVMINDGKLLVDNGNFTPDGEVVAIYEIAKNVTTSAIGVFYADTPLVSIDYINDVVDSIDFSEVIPTLEEVNLADGRATLSGYIRGLRVSDTNQLYVGISSRMPYNKDSFKGKKLVLPYGPGLTYTIPANCFAGNTDLLEVVIPRSCIGIGAGAFKGCTNLQHVFISHEVGTIGDGAFDGCTYPNLQFEVEPGNAKFVGFTGCLLEKDFTDNTYSILHATSSYFDPSSPHYFAKSNVCLDTAYSINFPSTFTLSTYPWSGMYAKTGGNVKLVDKFGYVITNTGKKITTKDTSIQMGGNYAVPIYFLIKEIKPNACAGDTAMTNVTLAQWSNASDPFVPGLWSLETIGAGAFKGCGISILKLFNTFNSADYIHYMPWHQHELAIGASAFEGCTSLGSLSFYCDCTIGAKAFFGCTGLTTLYNSSKSFICAKQLDSTGKNVEYGAGNIHRIGELAFGNTPNLASITGYNTFSNAIFDHDVLKSAEDTSGSRRVLLVGCKNTNLHQYLYVGEGAFYGCTGLTGTVGMDNVIGIGQNAFYGCTGISGINFYTTANVYSKAFYGCTNLHNLSLCDENSVIALYSQAFGKSGVNALTVPYNKVDLKATDVFEDCVFQTVSVSGNSAASGTPHPVASSSTSVENAFMTKYSTSGTPMTLIKGGNTSKTLNSWTGGTNGNLTEIKSNAFAGVSNVKSASPVEIPSTVLTLGSNIFNNSKINNSDSTTASMQLTPKILSAQTCVVNDGSSIALLLKLGGKYFERILNSTIGYHTNHLHYYHVDIASNSISLFETHGGTTSPIWLIGYSNSGSIDMHCFARINNTYLAQDNDTHITPLQTPIVFSLLAANQSIGPNRANKILSSAIIPGTTWMPDTDVAIIIPNDLATLVGSVYDSYNAPDSAFANTKWLANINSGRSLYNMKGGFKNCTSLTSINPYHDNSVWPSLDTTIFNATAPESIFEGCTGLVSLGGLGDRDYIVDYGKSSFKKTSYNNAYNHLISGITFEDECFSETSITYISIAGIESLSNTAFNGNNLNSAITFGYSGQFFTGRDEASICDVDGNIVVGSSSTDLSLYKGVVKNAFKNAKFTGYAPKLSGATAYRIGENAFAGSKVIRYRELNGTINTKIGKNAFAGCVDLVDVLLNTGATLDEGVFKGCTSLATLTLANGISISKECFSGCTALTEVALDAGIGENAFADCTGLTTAELKHTSNNHSTIEPSAFKNCPITQFRTVDGAITTQRYTITRYGVFEADDEITVLLGTNRYDAILNAIGTDFGDRIQRIGDYAYCGRLLTGDIVIPDTVTYIGDYAFANNPGITSVNIPSTVKYIGDHAFDGCTNLVSFTLPDSCTYLGEAALKGCALTKGFNCNAFDSQYTTWQTPVAGETGTIGSYTNTLDMTLTGMFNKISINAFSGSGIKVVRLPKVCTEVGTSAFEDCTKLIELQINSNITLDSRAFYGCANLKDIWLGSNVTTAPIISFDTLYGVGANVVSGLGRKTLHAPLNLNNTTFKNSYFYTTLIGMGFNPDWYAA